MKNTHLTSLGFTLVEVLVSITILSIIMVSVLSVYTTTINISARGEANRILQENIKNIIETIGEDIRKNGITGVSENLVDVNCDISNNKTGDKLCSGEDYYLAKINTSGTATRVEKSACSDIKDSCYIARSDPENRITNSSIAVENLEFRVTNDGVPKVTLLVTIRPAIGKGVKSHLIEKSKLTVQTTFSQRALAQ